MKRIAFFICTLFMVFMIIFISSCESMNIPVESSPEKTYSRKILRSQSKSIVHIDSYNDKGTLIKTGCGFFVSKDGLIITDYHLINNAHHAIVSGFEGIRYENVYLIDFDKEKDIALIKVDETNSTPIRLGDSNLSRQGEEVIFLANTGGINYFSSHGYISYIKTQEGIKVFLVTCSMHKENKGSPIFNIKGEVIGITASIPDKGSIGLAIPINYTKLFNYSGERISLTEKYNKEKKKLLDDYLERQSSLDILNPELSLYPEAYELYQKAIGFTEDSSSLASYVKIVGTDEEDSVKLLEEAININPYYHAAFFTLGRSYINTGKYKEAEKCLLRSIELMPKYDNQYIALARLYQDQGRDDEVLQVYNQALNKVTKKGWVYSSMGDFYLAKSDLDKAEKFYLKMLDTKLTIDLGHFNLAKLYLKKGKLKLSSEYLLKSDYSPSNEGWEELITLYKQHLSQDNYYAHLSLGFIYFKRDFIFEDEDAINHLEKALKLNRKEFDLYYELAMSYKKKYDLKRTILTLEKAIKKNPNHYNSLIELGKLYAIDSHSVDFYKKQYGIEPNYSGAIKLYNRAIQINPDKAEAYYCLGKLYYNTGKYEKAILETKSALNIKEDSDTYDQLGDIYLQIGNNSLALDNYKKSLQLQDTIFIRDKIANLLISIEEYEEAITFLNESIKKHQNTSDFKYLGYMLKSNLGMALIKKEDYSAAIKQFKEIIEESPDDSYAHFQIAYCYSKQGNDDEAEKWYLKTIDIDPEDANTYQNLGLIYFRKSNYRAALSYFKTALKYGGDKENLDILINVCKSQLEAENFPNKLNDLSKQEGNIGKLARLFLHIEEYAEANNLFITGVNETKPKYEKVYDKEIITQYYVSSKIFEAQGYFEKIISDLNNFSKTTENVKEIVNLIIYASEQRIKGIEQYSEGYYVKAKDYSGEWEKGQAKIDVADKYLVEALGLLQEEIKKYINFFSQIAVNRLNSLIEYFQKK